MKPDLVAILEQLSRHEATLLREKHAVWTKERSVSDQLKPFRQAMRGEQKPIHSLKENGPTVVQCSFGGINEVVVSDSNSNCLSQNTPTATVNGQYEDGSNLHPRTPNDNVSNSPSLTASEALQLDDDLCRIITAWSSLPKLTRQSITIIVDTAIQSIASEKTRPKRLSVQRRKDGGH